MTARSDLTVVMTGEEAKLRASQRRAAKGQDDLSKSTQRTGKESRKADAELKKFASRMARLNSTPTERATTRMSQLNQAVRKGYMDETRYHRAVSHTVRELARKGNMSQRAAAQQLGVSRSYATSEVSFSKYAGAVRVGFTAITASAAGYLAVMRQVSEIQTEAAEGVKAMAEGSGELQQMAMGDPEKQKLFKAAGEEFYSRGATTTADAAGLREGEQLAMRLESAGLLGERETFIQAGESRLFQPQQIGDLAANVSALTKALGKEEVGTSEQILSKALMASSMNPENVPALLSAASDAGAMANLMQVSDEDILASVAVTAGVTGSSSQGATQIDAFLKSLTKLSDEDREKYGVGSESFTGQSIEEMVRRIQGAGLDEGQLLEMFGRIEGVKAFSTLSSNLEQFVNLQRDVVAAQNENLFGKSVQANLDDINIHAALVERRTTAKEQLSVMDQGRVRLTADSMESERQRYVQERYGTFAAGAVQLMTRAERAALGDENFVRGDYAGALGGSVGFVMPMVDRMMPQFGFERDEGAEQLRSQTLEEQDTKRAERMGLIPRDRTDTSLPIDVHTNFMTPQQMDPTVAPVQPTGVVPTAIGGDSPGLSASGPLAAEQSTARELPSASTNAIERGTDSEQTRRLESALTALGDRLLAGNAQRGNRGIPLSGPRAPSMRAAQLAEAKSAE